MAARWLGEYAVFTLNALADSPHNIRDLLRSAAVISRSLTKLPISFSIKVAPGKFLRFPTESFLATLGLSAEEFRNTSLEKFIVEADRAKFYEWFTSPIVGSAPRYVYRAVSPLHGEYWVEVWRSSLDPNPGPEDSGDLFVIRDIDSMMRLQEANKTLAAKADEQMRILRRALDSSSDGFAIWDAVRDIDGSVTDFRLSFINDAGARPAGKTPQQLEGKNFQEVSGGNNDLEELFRSALRDDEPKVEVVQVNSPQGWFGAYENRAFPFNNSQLLLLFRDVTEEGRETRRLTWLTQHDQLTGGFNRRYMETVLEQALAASKEEGNKVGFVFLDIDFFKRINDDYGHDVGDQVLIDFVTRMTNLVAGAGELARIAGDEFAIIIPKLEGEESLVRVLDRIFEGLKTPFTFGDQSIMVNCSAGAIVVGGDVPPSETMRLADHAMYQAKHEGRNRYVIA